MPSQSANRRARRSARAVVAAVALVVLAGVPASAGPETSDGDAGEEILAVVNAGGGTFRKSGDHYRLTLNDVTPRAVWFDDRPGRAAGSYSIEELAEDFFAGDADPNAALEVFDGRGAGDVVVVTLSDPRYDADRARLVLDASVLEIETLAATSLAPHAERATPDVPRRFGAAALFIDNAVACPSPYWYNGGGLESLNGITCETAQAVAQAAAQQHPPNIGVDQYIYDFGFVTETWHALDQQDQAFFTRTDHGVSQSFAWYDCYRERC